jgi:hypothetical protein
VKQLPPADSQITRCQGEPFRTFSQSAQGLQKDLACKPRIWIGSCK